MITFSFSLTGPPASLIWSWLVVVDLPEALVHYDFLSFLILSAQQLIELWGWAEILDHQLVARASLGMGWSSQAAQVIVLGAFVFGHGGHDPGHRVVVCPDNHCLVVGQVVGVPEVTGL